MNIFEREHEIMFIGLKMKRSDQMAVGSSYGGIRDVEIEARR